jgi:formylglycine-generating enzyme required for sulfatase activity/uncharacterized caspase-like protein
LAATELASTGLERGSSAALFVGVNEFGADSGLENLDYAVDDAVALAHVLVAELQLIPPPQATLALGGRPRTDGGRQFLTALEKLGAKVIAAERQKVLAEIVRLANRATDPRGLVVFSFSTHGFEKEGSVYLMPQDCLRELFTETGIPLNTVKERLRTAKPNKKLLLYDACRREPTKGGGMSEVYRKALAAAEGFGILASCGTDEVSWEDPQLEHGVFTHFLLEGLRGAAAADATDGLLRLDSVAAYASDATIKWVQQKKSVKQEPWSELSGEARKIPLAANSNVLEKLAASKAAEDDRQRQAEEARQGLLKRKEKAQDLLSTVQRAHREAFPLGTKQEVEAAIETQTGADLETLLEHVELMADKKKAAVQSFVAWWRLEGFKLLESTPPPPVFGDQLARYTNGLGMVFTALPGVTAKFSIWETRVRDFRAFVRATSHNARSNVFSLTPQTWVQNGATWDAPGFVQTELHPVCGVSWEDAQAFCQWLTEKERKEVRIRPSAAYRLPQDAEWSTTAGPGKYVWGEDWPPPRVAGNLAGEEAKDKDWPEVYAVIQGYNDGYARTAPVGSFRANVHGLYDVAGNVWEWCEEWYRKEMNTEEVLKAFSELANDGGGQKYRLLRGASWVGGRPLSLASSMRRRLAPEARDTGGGFRCVLGEGTLR